jgi:ATP-binding cassette subfamily F protein uup
MPLLTLTDAHLAYGHVPLLDGAAFSLEDGERVALIGRNGAGKSSLLKILAGLERVDDGLLQAVQGVTRFYVPQEPLFAADATVFDVVAEGVAEARALRERYEAHDPADDLDAVQTRLEALGGWTWEQRVDETLQRLHLDGSAVVGTLSGGTKKRVALAQALVAQPDVLLLDEPTNHLDLDAIDWLQSLLATSRHATVLISHDRAFIDAVATRIVELDRGILRSYPGNYAAYEATKARELESEALANARADKLLAAEEVWVRKGVEARRTRSVGRIARLQKLRAERVARRERVGQVRLEVDSGLPSGKIVAALEDVSFKYFEPQGLAGASPPPEGSEPARERPSAGSATVLIDHFSATFLRGDKVGLVGPNGAGKTTLLKLILGELEPTGGSVRRGTNLQVAYFDQLREGLSLDATLADTISPGSEWVEIGGAKKHVMSYLGDFLFSPARADAPVRTLSGGERNRLLLARLFALPANVIVLDEPTNDLDIETLELLEALLADYKGTAFLVSHDRRFVDNVVTSVVAWEGDPDYGGRPGLWREYEGGITDWLTQRERARVVASAPSSAPAARPAAAAPAPARSKLSYKEQRELEALPARIATLEAEQKSIAERTTDPALYAREPQQAAALLERATRIEDELMAALERWTVLDARR